MNMRAVILIAFGLAAAGAEGYGRFIRGNPANATLVSDAYKKLMAGLQRAEGSAEVETAAAERPRHDAQGRRLVKSISIKGQVQEIPIGEINRPGAIKLPDDVVIPDLMPALRVPALNFAKVCNPGQVHADRFAALAYVSDENGVEREVVNVGADLIRHPASLTKMMTLLIAFTRVGAFKLKLDETVPFSAHARSAPAASIAEERGTLKKQAFTVHDVMMAVGVRSANDAARALAEKISGSEDKFVILMNAVARHIGMKNTIFANATGLPDPVQVTTARDMMVLEKYLERHFETYLKYLSTRSFRLAGTAKAKKKAPSVTVETGNELLLRTINGNGGNWRVVSAKTGFIEASAYNMVLKAERIGTAKKGQTLHMVVMGGASRADRNDCIRAIAARL